MLCHHVDSIPTAQTYLKENHSRLKLILLDNFVKVESETGLKTGSEWLAEIHETYPKNKRDFVVALISGHAEVLGKIVDKADIVLPKPWKASQLIAKLKEFHVI